MDIIRKIIQKITKKPRLRIRPGVDFEWQDGEIVVNAFRLYEMVFGRKRGLRFEGAMFVDEEEGIAYHVFGTAENFLAHVEYRVREFLNGFKLGFKIVPVPQIAIAGMPGFSMPSAFMFAIAYDTSALSTTGANTATATMTVSGSNTMFLGCHLTGSTNNGWTSGSYNGVAVTGLSDQSIQTNYSIHSFYLIGPATGSHTASSTSVSGFFALFANYSGVSQNGPSGFVANSASTAITININTATANSWGVFFAAGNNNTPSAGTNSTGRSLNPSGSTQPSLFDSNGIITTGGFNMTANGFSAQPIGAVGFAIVEAAIVNVNISASDSITTSESVSIIVVDRPNVSDSSTASENIQISVLESFNVFDSTTLSENVQITVFDSVSASDSVTTSENVQIIVFDQPIVNDTVTTSEGVSVIVISSPNVFDSTTTSENVQILIPTLFISVSDSTTVTEQVAILVIDIPTILDSAIVSENVQLLVLSSVSVFDLVTTSENVQVVIGILPSVSDSVTVSENVKLLVTEFLSVSDSVTTAENVSIIIPTLFVGVSDAIGTTESVSMLLISDTPVFDSVSVSENLNIGIVSIISVFDSTTVQDVVQEEEVIVISAGRFIVQLGFKTTAYIIKLNAT